MMQPDRHGLRKSADLALYRAKALGRGTRSWFEQIMDEEFRERAETRRRPATRASMATSLRFTTSPSLASKRAAFSVSRR